MTPSPSGRSRAKVAILGASGFAGAELLRRLLLHPGVEIIRVAAADHVGEPIESAHPHLAGQSALRFENPEPEAAIAGADVVVMGLPQEASLAVVEIARERAVRILDLSGAFRLQNPESYARFYGKPHPRP